MTKIPAYTALTDDPDRLTPLLETLRNLTTTVVDDRHYLSADLALGAVADTILEDAEIVTQEEYEQLQTLTMDLLQQELNYGTTVSLAPPKVPFSARGEYWQPKLEITSELIAETIDYAADREYATTRLEFSVDNLASRILARMINNGDYRSQHEAANAEKDTVVTLIRDYLLEEQSEWKSEHTPEEIRHLRTYNDWWRKPQPPDNINDETINSFKERLARYFISGNAVSASSVYSQALRHFYTGYVSKMIEDPDALPEPIHKILSDALVRHSYTIDRTEAGYLIPMPLDLPDDFNDRLVDALDQLIDDPNLQTTTNTGIVVVPEKKIGEVMAAVADLPEFPNSHVPEIQESVLWPWLARRGYRNRLSYVGRVTGKAYYPLMQVAQTTDPKQCEIRLAPGFPVHAPIQVVDPEAERIILLQMLGDKANVRASWAAIMDAGHRAFVNSIDVSSGMDDYFLMKEKLPETGWYEYMLVNKQLSPKELKPSHPFYALYDPSTDINQPPTSFFPCLARAIRTPLKPEWTPFLWEEGQKLQLIEPINADSRGYGAWKVHAERGNEWEAMISEALVAETITI